MILMTGGNGILGTEIQKLDGDAVPTEIDIRKGSALFKLLEDFKSRSKSVTVLHLAALTDPLSHDENPIDGILTNIYGTAMVSTTCHTLGVRLVYTSTDYNYIGKGPHKEDEPQLPPYNFGWSKLGGECSVAMIPNSLILRLSHGPRPFPWDKVYKGQTNSKLYVDQMAPLVLKAAKSEACGIMNLGGPPRTLEEYARETKPDIETIPKPDWVPADTSLDLTRMEEL